MSSTSSPFVLCSNTTNTTTLTKQDLYGGAITMSFAADFKDVSSLRVVPDHQEVWTDDGHDNTIIIELLNLKEEVSTDDAASFFFNDLAEASDATSADLMYAGLLDSSTCPHLPDNVDQCGAVGCHLVAKFHDEKKSGASARNRVMVYVINLRLLEFGTDILLTMYRTVQIGESSSTTEVKEIEDGDNADFPGLMDFISMLKTVKIVDSGLFG